MAMVEISVVPLGTSTPSVSQYVAGEQNLSIAGGVCELFRFQGRAHLPQGAAQIDQGIAHAALGRVDGAGGQVGDFGKGHAGQLPKQEYVSLLSRQRTDGHQQFQSQRAIHDLLLDVGFTIGNGF